MKYLILLIVIAGAALFVLTMLKAWLAPDRETASGGGDARGTDYEALRSVISPGERAFVSVLATVLPPGVGILAKTRLADVFTASRKLPSSKRSAALSRISRRHVDFLLIRADDFSPLAGIEFEDPAGRAEDRPKADPLVDAMFAASGIPLLRVRGQSSYNAPELGRQIAAILGKTGEL